MLKLNRGYKSVVGGPTHKYLSVERSSPLNVETEPFWFSLPHMSPMCSFTLPDIFFSSLLFFVENDVYGDTLVINQVFTSVCTLSGQ